MMLKKTGTSKEVDVPTAAKSEGDPNKPCSQGLWLGLKQQQRET